MIESLVDFVYSDENVAWLAWVPRKSLLNKSKQWSDISHWDAMKSLVLKSETLQQCMVCMYKGPVLLIR